MATIKVFDANGVKDLQCFDTLSDVPYEDIETPEDLLPDFEIEQIE